MSGLRAIRRCDWPRLISTRMEDLSIFDSAFERIDNAMRGAGYAPPRTRLWRFSDGSFVGRCFWRKAEPHFAPLRYTVTGDNLVFLHSAPGLAR